jgi:uncharacterized cupin superfamily protein
MTVNLDDPGQDDFATKGEQEGFRSRRLRLGKRAGAERLGLSLWEVPVGEAAYPYHFHLGEEEMLVVLEGNGRLRTPSGWRDLSEGEVISFAAGEAGAHQVICDGPAALRFLAISTSAGPDIVVYPDSNKIGAFERRPDGGGVWELHDRTAAVDYWTGETPTPANA